MVGIPCLEDDMRAHSQWMGRQSAEGLQVDRQILVTRCDAWQFLVRIAGCAAVSRHMLETADDACARHPVEHCAAQRSDLQRIAAQRAIADYIVCFLAAHVERRVVIYRDAHFRQFAAHCLGVGARGLDRGSGCDVPQPRESLARRIALPHGRLHARHAAAFLVDGDNQLLAPVNRAQVVGQPPQLRLVLAIAREQDVARRIGIGEEGAFLLRKRGAGNAENGRCHIGKMSADAVSRKFRPRVRCGKRRQ